MRFYKFQALGNDFLIARESELRAVTDDFEAFARTICDRHFGAGADGLEVLSESAEADFAIRLFNADGGETPISGNGTRCVAAYLYLIENWNKPTVRIATGAGVKALTLTERNGGRFVFATEMGTAKLRSEEIPVLLPQPLERVVRQSLEINGQQIEFTAVSMGNPHCSLLVKSFDDFDWRALGAALETHPAFPERTNVEFIRVLNRNEITVRFWERGVGETLASGTGACGAALAAMLNDLTERRVNVVTAAGRLIVEWREDGTVMQTGEACAVYRGEWFLDLSRPPKQDDELNLLVVSYIPNIADAGMAYDLLLSNGLQALLEGSEIGALSPMASASGYRLLVPEEEYERAQELLRTYFFS